MCFSRSGLSSTSEDKYGQGICIIKTGAACEDYFMVFNFKTYVIPGQAAFLRKSPIRKQWSNIGGILVGPRQPSDITIYAISTISVSGEIV